VIDTGDWISNYYVLINLLNCSSSASYQLFSIQSLLYHSMSVYITAEL